MKIYELIIEKRREPEKNPKVVGHESVVKKLQQMGDLSNVGVSMTAVPKLGMNVKSDYQTPIGVYFYPAEYYLDVKTKGKSLPFADDAPYIQIFQWNTENVLEIDKLSQEGYNNLKGKLVDIFGKSALSQAFSAEEKPLVDSPGGYIWFLMWYLTHDSKNPGAPWNKLLRQLNIDVVVDTGIGHGIIHRNEPHQGFVVNPRVISHIDTIQQQYYDQGANPRMSPRALLHWAQYYKKPLPPKLENMLLDDDDVIMAYLLQVNPNWKKGKEYIKTEPKKAAEYAVKRGEPWPEAEPFIVNDPVAASNYARYALKDPEYQTWATRFKTNRVP